MGAARHADRLVGQIGQFLVEEKIDELIESKKQLTRDLLEGGAELNLTEMSDEALLDLVKLDLSAAMRE